MKAVSTSVFDESIALSNLILDPQNPRHEVARSQREAIKTMLQDQGDKILRLAEDILAHGVDPSARPIVIPELDAQPPAGGKNRYIVVEGNRRVTALLLLNEPALLPDETPPTQKNRYKALSAEYLKNPIRKLSCVVFPSRSAASHWIRLRHTGANNGVGIVEWGTIEQARFNHQFGEKSVSLHVVTLVRDYGKLPTELMSLIDDVPLTNIQRLINDPNTRDFLGVEIRNGELWSKHPTVEVMKGLRRIIADFAMKKINVNTIRTKKDRANYLETFRADEIPDLGKELPELVAVGSDISSNSTGIAALSALPMHALMSTPPSTQTAMQAPLGEKGLATPIQVASIGDKTQTTQPATMTNHSYVQQHLTPHLGATVAPSLISTDLGPAVHQMPTVYPIDADVVVTPSTLSNSHLGAAVDPSLVSTDLGPAVHQMPAVYPIDAGAVVTPSIANEPRPVEQTVVPMGPKDNASQQLSPSTAVPTPAPRQVSKPHSITRRSLIPSNCIIRPANQRVNDIYRELKSLDVEQYPNAVAICLRVFLELSLEYYIEKHQLSVPADKLKIKLQVVRDHMKENNILNPQQIKPMNVALASEDSLISVHTLHAYVHNVNMIPNATALRSTWDQLQLFAQKLWN